MKNKKRWLVLMATPEEEIKFNRIKEEYAINQDAAMIRFMINQEYKKILEMNISKEQNAEGRGNRERTGRTINPRA